MPASTTFVPREVSAQPSTAAVQTMRERYLAAPLMVDLEYLRHYTAAHQATDGLNAIERRAESHARALEQLTPVIRPGELLVGSKTRFVRGAIPYANYATHYILRSLNQEEQEAQDKFTDIGTGGGIQHTQALAASGEYTLFGKKFLISAADRAELHTLAQYWVGKCMQDVGDRFWKTAFAQADYIEKGWQAGLYTAPHDPAPEGRYVLDFETALAQGFNGLIARMRQKIQAAEITDYASAQKVFFWRAGIRVLEGTLAWVNHYAQQARTLAAQETDPQRQQALLAIATRCEHAPAEPPRDFREALQAFWLIYLAGHIEGAQLGYSPGRFDRYMFPYFERDIQAGRITPAEVLELLEALRVKMTEIEYMASFSWEGLGSGNLYQNMILGGLDAQGRRGDNALSTLIIQSAINCQTTQPTLSIWYDDALSDEFLLTAVACIKTGAGFPAFFNLKTYLQHELERSHLPLATIRQYAAMGGCTEPTLEGMSYGVVQAGFINHVKVLELALHGGVDPRSGLVFEATPLPTTAAELMAAYKFHLRHTIRNWQRYWNYVMAAHRDTCNLIYSAVLIRDCIERGQSLDDGGAVINHTPTTLSTGMVNVVNSLAAVQHLVEDTQVVTLAELRRALQVNWEGFAPLRKQALAAPKWGNNDDRADGIYVELFATYCQYVAEQKNYLGEPYDPSMLAISTHAPFGKACDATPDGRRAGETLADGVTSPMPGTDQNGPLAVLHSASKLEHTRIRGGLHNMKFLPTTLKGPAGARKLLQLVKTYFDSLGFQLQFNVVDSRLLREAQGHPEQYRDLIVRVAGFSAFFVELGKSMQDEIIARTEHQL